MNFKLKLKHEILLFLKKTRFHAFNISSYHSCNAYLTNSLYHFPDKWFFPEVAHIPAVLYPCNPAKSAYWYTVFGRLPHLSSNVRHPVPDDNSSSCIPYSPTPGQGMKTILVLYWNARIFVSLQTGLPSLCSFLLAALAVGKLMMYKTSMATCRMLLIARNGLFHSISSNCWQRRYSLP